MSIENKQSDNAAMDNAGEVETNNSNLIALDESNGVGSGSDINTKISSLDSDLAQLRMELGSINNSVEEGLDRLSDTGTDITAKVSETYKRLGEIDNAYKSLIDISSRIENDIQKLNGNVSTVAEQSASGIKSLEQSTLVQSHELVQKNQQVASRVSQLVETSKLTSELFNQKIQSTTDMMLQIERKVVNEIESLSGATKEKTELIASSVESNKAKILKLQSVDEAIIRRATTLEISSAELTVTSQRMDSSIGQLALNAEVLSHNLDSLKERTEALEELTANHGSLIGGLQKAASDVSDKLAVLAGRESRHFNLVTSGFLLLLVMTAVIFFYQQHQFALGDANYTERDGVVDSKIVSLQQTQINSEVSMNNSLAALESKMEEQIVQVENKILSMQDQVQSVDGRLNYSSPFSQIGDDNVIHGPQWIAALPQKNFVVQLAYVNDKNTIYEVAQRYNYYLKDSLSYFQSSEQGAIIYVLLSGNYTTRQQAQTAMKSLPGMIERQRPQVMNVGTIQEFITH